MTTTAETFRSIHRPIDILSAGSSMRAELQGHIRNSTRAVFSPTSRLGGHHTALPYGDVPAFFARLEEATAGGEVSRLALRFLILTAARTGEVLGARRLEFDLGANIWTIPAERMKAGRLHRVPLSHPTMLVVRRALKLPADGDLLFPGARRDRPLSNMVFLMLLRRLEVEATTHGFRSAFSDWCAETTSFPAEVREMALAHTIGNKTEAAHRRGDLFEKRRKLMNAALGDAQKSAPGSCSRSTTLPSGNTPHPAPAPSKSRWINRPLRAKGWLPLLNS